MRPYLACDADLEKLTFPKALLPKIDGVRGINVAGQLRPRSMKQFANAHVRELFSHPDLLGLDGELTCGSIPYSERLCFDTVSATSTIQGAPNVHWWIFDMYNAETATAPYAERYQRAGEIVARLQDRYPIHMVPGCLVNSIDEVLQHEKDILDMEYEGIILRDPLGRYKLGRGTVKEGGFLRVKRFIEEEALVVGMTEGMTNTNEATTSALGLQTRSTEKAGMVPNGMVGNFICKSVADIKWKGKVLFKKDSEFTIAPGCMSHAERVFYFQNPHFIIGKIIKFKYFPIGVKDKPRMPIFMSIRDLSDI